MKKRRQAGRLAFPLMIISTLALSAYIGATMVDFATPPYTLGEAIKGLNAEEGAPSGLAQLDETGKVPAAQLPAEIGLGDMLASANLSDLTSVATAKVNLGLNAVNNTSDANKPISTATQTALDGKTNAAFATAESNIVVGASPFTYQNMGTSTESIIVNGAAVGGSIVNFSRDNITFYEVLNGAGGVDSGVFDLSPGDYVKVTYAIAPTFIKVPR